MYPMDLLTDALLILANHKTREDLITNGHQTDNYNTEAQKMLYFIMEYNPQSPPMKDIIQTHWPILGRSNATRALIDCKIVFGFSRPKKPQGPSLQR